MLREARRSLADELGLDPGPRLQELERAILTHDPALAVPPRVRAPVAPPAAQRSIMVAQLGDAPLDSLIGLAGPLAARSDRELLVTALVGDAGRLGEAARALNERREELLRDGVSARSASFTSRDAGADIVRLAQQQDTDLLLVESPPGLLGDRAPRGDPRRRRPATSPSWSAGRPTARCWSRSRAPSTTGPRSSSEPGWRPPAAARSCSRDRPAMAAGATPAGCSPTRRSRSSAPSGVAAEPLLVAPDPGALAAAATGMGLVVVGLSRRWQQEGLGPGAQRARRARGRRDAARAPRTAAGRPRARRPRDPVHVDDSAARVDHFAQGGGVARVQSVVRRTGRVSSRRTGRRPSDRPRRGPAHRLE